MGMMFDPGNEMFQRALRSEIYVDKTGLLAVTNRLLNTENCFLCISRPRRFGKSMAMNMLCAYYSKSCDSEGLFSGYQIAKEESFPEHLNRYHVIQFNMKKLLNKADTISEVIRRMIKEICFDIEDDLGNIRLRDPEDLSQICSDIYRQTKTAFIFLIDEKEIYNPHSVVQVCMKKKFDSYWTKTETYEALKIYIEMNYDGLRDTVVKLLAGERAVIDTTSFTNDMVTFENKDDVLTLLVHLGYLTYDFDTREVFIPNQEIAGEFASTIKVLGWSEVADALKQSDDLLKETISGNEKKVAETLEIIHRSETSIMAYNDENALASVISLVYYSARRSYVIYRELPSGNGYADLTFIPRKHTTTPAMVVELKVNRTVETALSQIKKKHYTEGLRDYQGEILLVGINYDKEKKEHSCQIERVEKEQ